MSYLIFIPVLFLILSTYLAIRSVKKGGKRKNAVIAQICAFLAVCALTFTVPTVAHAAANDVPAAATSDTAPAADSSKGISMLAVALSTGLAGIGGGIAVAAAAPAAIGATSEDPKSFGKALIFVALGEGIAIYGLLMSILMLNRI